MPTTTIPPPSPPPPDPNGRPSKQSVTVQEPHPRGHEGSMPIDLESAESPPPTTSEEKILAAWRKCAANKLLDASIDRVNQRFQDHDQKPQKTINHAHSQHSQVSHLLPQNQSIIVQVGLKSTYLPLHPLLLHQNLHVTN